MSSHCGWVSTDCGIRSCRESGVEGTALAARCRLDAAGAGAGAGTGVGVGVGVGVGRLKGLSQDVLFIEASERLIVFASCVKTRETSA